MHMVNICAFPHILGSPSSYMTLQLLHSEFPYIQYEENLIFFFISAHLSFEQTYPWDIIFTWSAKSWQAFRKVCTCKKNQFAERGGHGQGRGPSFQQFCRWDGSREYFIYVFLLKFIIYYKWTVIMVILPLFSFWISQNVLCIKKNYSLYEGAA